MLDDIRCRGDLNIVRDSEVTCGSVLHRHRFGVLGSGNSYSRPGNLGDLGAVLQPAGTKWCSGFLLLYLRELKYCRIARELKYCCIVRELKYCCIVRELKYCCIVRELKYCCIVQELKYCCIVHQLKYCCTVRELKYCCTVRELKYCCIYKS